MRGGLILLTLLGTAACQQVPEVGREDRVSEAPVPRCAYDRDAMLALDVETFNSTPDAGWRLIGNVPGCELAGADLLALYRTSKDGLSADEEAGLLHHEFQLRASSGEADAAIAIARRLIEFRTDDPPMRTYHEAELAFMLHDLEALEVARDRLAAEPEPDSFREGVAKFKEKYPDYPEHRWPLNLDVVEGFINCFDRPYAEAYTFSCRPDQASE